MTITFCTTQASLEHRREVEGLTVRITAETTPEQLRQLFVEHCHNNPACLTSGAGWDRVPPLIHVIMTNPRLIDPLIEIGGRHLLQITSRLTRITPLVTAVRTEIPAAERYEMVKRLIELGAPVNQAGRISPFGSTPLEAALFRNRQDLIRLLLEHGAVMPEDARMGTIPEELASAAPVDPSLEWPDKSRGIQFAHEVQHEIAEIKRQMPAALLAALPNIPADLIPLIRDYAGHLEDRH